jgi:hypothetical protein
MKKEKQHLVIEITLVLSIIFLIGCTQNTEKNGSNNLQYLNEEYGFGLNPPEGWTITNESTPFTAVYFYIIVEKSIINLVIMEPVTLKNGETLSNLTEQALKEYPNYMKNFTLISSNERTINDMNAYEIVYNFTQDNHTYTRKQVMIQNNNEYFTIMYSAIQSSYNIYNDVVEQSINSFTIT